MHQVRKQNGWMESVSAMHPHITTLPFVLPFSSSPAAPHPSEVLTAVI